MTEDEWLAATDPGPMLEILGDEVASNRKLRLFAVACCRRVDKLITDDRCRVAVQLAEQCALVDDMGKPFEQMSEAHDAAERQMWRKVREIVIAGRRENLYLALLRRIDETSPDERCLVRQEMLANAAAVAAAYPTIDEWFGVYSAFAAACLASSPGDRPEFWDTEAAVQSAVLRCIMGNPFRTSRVEIAPEWLNDSVLTHALEIDENGTFDRLPKLADALEAAGCRYPDILEHCRGPGPHARGCWVVDALLAQI